MTQLDQQPSAGWSSSGSPLEQNRSRRPTPDQSAKELASKAIDRLTVGAPDNDEKASRKRRLIKGPEEFREDRVDLPKAKGNERIPQAKAFSGSA